MSGIKNFEELSYDIKSEFAESETRGKSPLMSEAAEALTPTSAHIEMLLIQNDNRVCVKKLTMRELFEEVIRTFTHALNKKGVNSICSDTFGFLSQMDSTPKTMKRVEYDFCGKMFYVLKNSSREALIYDVVVNAAKTCEGDSFTFPLVTKVPLSVLITPIDEFKGIKEEQYLQYEADTLTFTPEEIKYLSFSFIKQVKLVYDPESLDPYKNATLVFDIDREVLNLAPYERG